MTVTETGLQPARGKATKNARMLKRPRLVIHCEASIVQEMHELAFKNGRSVSSLAEWALARLLADFSTGRIEIDQDRNPQLPIGRA